IGPQVSGDRIAETGAGAEGQQRCQCLGVAPGEPDGPATSDDLEPSEKTNGEPWRLRFGHVRCPPQPPDLTPGPSPHGPDVRVGGRSKSRKVLRPPPGW